MDTGIDGGTLLSALHYVSNCTKRPIRTYVVPSNGMGRLRLQKKFCIAQNTEKYGTDGHWLCWLCLEPGKLEFFDSLGRNPDSYNIQYPTGKFTKIHCILDRRLQSNYSNVCGLYCIYYFYQRFVLRRSPACILNDFSSSFRQNDRLVLKFYESLQFIALKWENEPFCTQSSCPVFKI
jgi:hypothetical protein